ncbi:hypothetical protein L6R53_16885 [Myxococcota bacterium]|nr:hypothetical protein [Myxococcota bacterium]
MEGPLWQRGDHDHILRDEADLDAHREDIQDNPLRWDLDDENPSRARRGAPA